MQLSYPLRHLSRRDSGDHLGIRVIDIPSPQVLDALSWLAKQQWHWQQYSVLRRWISTNALFASTRNTPRLGAEALDPSQGQFTHARMAMFSWRYHAEGRCCSRKVPQYDAIKAKQLIVNTLVISLDRGIFNHTRSWPGTGGRN